MSIISSWRKPSKVAQPLACEPKPRRRLLPAAKALPPGQGARVVLVTLAFLALTLTAHAQAPPSTSVRPPASRTIQGSVTALLGWNVGLPSTAFGQITLAEAAVRTDAAGLGYLEASSANLDYRLSADDLAVIKNKLAELRMRAPAYSLESLPSDGASRRKLFEFAKALSVEMLITRLDTGALAEFDKLAGEFNVKVAFHSADPKAAIAALQSHSPRLGLAADLAAWTRARVNPIDALPLVHERLLAVRIPSRFDAAPFLLAVSKLNPPETPAWPHRCGNCGGPRVPTRPLFLTVESATAVAALETALRPAMGYRVNELSRKTPITSTDKVPAADRAAIEAALPKEPIAKPRRPRRLLVTDLCPQGGYYHTTIAHANLALEFMAKTGAYEAVFDNNLDNLKYPAIRKFDAVFLNSVVGEVFIDPAVLDGLLRFVREGGGVAGIHGSTYASMNLPEYGEMMGGQDGPHRVEPGVLAVDDPDTPLTRHFRETSFPYVDEYYRFLATGPYSRDKLRVLLRLDADKTDLVRGRPLYLRPDSDYGLSWIKSYGKGRVFNCALGHTPTLFATPELARHVLAGIQFVLGDLDADTTPSAKRKAAAAK